VRYYNKKYKKQNKKKNKKLIKKKKGAWNIKYGGGLQNK